MVYKDFNEFWEANYRSGHESLRAKRIALRAWDAAVDGQTMEVFSNSEVYTEAILRGFEVRRTDKSDGGNNE